MNWEKTTIGEHCTVTSSKRFHLSERSTSGVPFYCSKEIIQKVNGHEIIECDYIREELYEQVKKQFGVPKTGDLLITTRGTYGVPYIYSATDRFYFADGNLTWLKDFDKKLLPEFLLYWVKSHEGQGKIDAIAKGTAQKAVPIISIKALEIPLPPITQQKRIIDILSAYDNLIENNQKQIKLLEEAAQRLHKEWFVDLRFPGYETTPVVDGVSKGWKWTQLADIAAVNKRSISKDYSFEYIDYIDIGSVSAGRIESKTRYMLKDAPGRAKRVVCDGDVIWGMVRPNLKSYALVFHPQDTTIASTGFAVLSAKKVPFSFLYCHVIQDEFISYLVNCTNGAAYPAVKPIHFEEANILVPTNSLLEKFQALAEPMFRKIEVLSKQIEVAAEARDRLLPKLMSGELEV